MCVPYCLFQDVKTFSTDHIWERVKVGVHALCFLNHYNSICQGDASTMLGELYLLHELVKRKETSHLNLQNSKV